MKMFLSSKFVRICILYIVILFSCLTGNIFAASHSQKGSYDDRIDIRIATNNFVSDEFVIAQFENFLNHQLVFNPVFSNTDYLNRKLEALFPNTNGLKEYFFTNNDVVSFRKEKEKLVHYLEHYYNSREIREFLVYQIFHPKSSHL